MSIIENEKTPKSITYNKKNIFKYIYKPWKWIDGEWVKETFETSSAEVSK